MTREAALQALLAQALPDATDVAAVQNFAACRQQLFAAVTHTSQAMNPEERRLARCVAEQGEQVVALLGARQDWLGVELQRLATANPLRETPSAALSGRRVKRVG